jgi:8-hydroxy-5-deazaflavin:NADPH oxidoreductase
MRVTIIGTGNMGRAVASRALAGGHEVTFIGTHLAKAQEVADEMFGEGQVEASERINGDLVVLAVPYTEAPQVVREYAVELSGKVIIDPTNPVDLGSLDLVDRAWLGPFASGAQLIQAEAPDDAAFVKAFNTNFAGPLLAGQVHGEPLDVFIAGDDPTAKAAVMRLATDGGMRGIDAGRLSRARELEAMALLHMEIQGSRGTAFASAIKVIP